MQSILISTGQRSSYPLIFDSIDTLDSVVLEALGRTPTRIVIVTDTNVAALYGVSLKNVLSRICAVSVITVAAGEASKSSGSLSFLYDEILGLEVDRTTPIIAFGGGVVGDLVGFTAATILRGVPLIHVPTTLTAQVDSSIGGKTGINHAMGKNLIGAFYPPRAILCDTSLLDSLPANEWISGLGEVVKHAYLDGGEHYESLRLDWTGVVNRREMDANRLVRRSAQVKARIVQQDEKEAGKRMWLNLGHTTGHAIERITGYSSFSHGEAVAVGLAVALELSLLRSFDVDSDLAYYLARHMDLFDRVRALDPAEVYSATSTDKKRRDNSVPFVLLREVGAPYIVSELAYTDFAAGWKNMLSQLQR